MTASIFMSYPSIAKFFAPLALSISLVSAVHAEEKEAQDKMTPEQSAQVLQLALANHG